MARRKTEGASSPPGGRSTERREQQRSIDSRLAILDAALSEFANKGFDGTSMRDIGDRANLHYTLITYHFRNKEALWRATAEHFFEEAVKQIEKEVPPVEGADPIDRTRHMFHAVLQFSFANPDFYHFVIREGRENSPRLGWLTETFVAPLMKAIVPQIEAAQLDGDLPNANPILLYYFMLGITTTFRALGAEMHYHSGISPTDPDCMNAYWRLVEQIVFKRKRYIRSS